MTRTQAGSHLKTSGNACKHFTEIAAYLSGIDLVGMSKRSLANIAVSDNKPFARLMSETCNELYCLSIEMFYEQPSSKRVHAFSYIDIISNCKSC